MSYVFKSAGPHFDSPNYNLQWFRFWICVLDVEGFVASFRKTLEEYWNQKRPYLRLLMIFQVFDFFLFLHFCLETKVFLLIFL